MNDTVVAIVSAFFVIGILVGIIIVVAIRAERRREPADLLDYEWDDTGPDRHPRWPGEADNDFSDQ